MTRVTISKFKLERVIKKQFGDAVNFRKCFELSRSTYYDYMRDGWPIKIFWGLCHVLNCEDEDLT